MAHAHIVIFLLYPITKTITLVHVDPTDTELMTQEQGNNNDNTVGFKVSELDCISRSINALDAESKLLEETSVKPVIQAPWYDPAKADPSNYRKTKGRNSKVIQEKKDKGNRNTP